jgi:adenosylcobinamide-GDP ribazoletransferase
MKKELRVFFTALMFYTRIPCPKWVDHNDDYINQATRYFPFIGWLVGTVCFMFLFGASQLFPLPVAVVISIIAGVFLTGAFHEDGFADVCDGFGGGWTKEKILLIMKDSRVGAYGVIGLVLLLLLKASALHTLATANWKLLACLIVAAHCLSRWMAVVIIFSSHYAREDETSKAKPIAKQLSIGNFIIASIFACGPLAVLVWQNWYYLFTVVPSFFATLYLRNYYTKWIGGYTGDCLGATQQVTEVGLYLSFLALWKFM